MGEADIEALVVEIDHVPQSRGRTVVKIRRPRREAAQDRSFEPTDILAFAGDHRASRIGYLIDLSGERALAERAGDREHRQTGNIEYRGGFFARIGNTDVEGRLYRMMADIRRVSWQVPQKPGIVGTLRSSLRPATPMMLIFALLNTSSPRAMERRCSLTMPRS